MLYSIYIKNIFLTTAVFAIVLSLTACSKDEIDDADGREKARVTQGCEFLNMEISKQIRECIIDNSKRSSFGHNNCDNPLAYVVVPPGDIRGDSQNYACVQPGYYGFQFPASSYTTNFTTEGTPLAISTTHMVTTDDSAEIFNFDAETEDRQLELASETENKSDDVIKETYIGRVVAKTGDRGTLFAVYDAYTFSSMFNELLISINLLTRINGSVSSSTPETAKSLLFDRIDEERSNGIFEEILEVIKDYELTHESNFSIHITNVHNTTTLTGKTAYTFLMAHTKSYSIFYGEDCSYWTQRICVFSADEQELDHEALNTKFETLLTD